MATSIPEGEVLKLIVKLLRFPRPTICRHAVCADLLSLLEQHGYPLTKELAYPVVDANDEKALQELAVLGYE